MGLFDGILGGIDSAITGILGASAANNQANAATNSATQANALLQNIYNQTRTDQTPFRNAGTAAINQLAYSLGLGTPPANSLAASTAENYPAINQVLNDPRFRTSTVSQVDPLVTGLGDTNAMARYPAHTNVGIDYLDHKFGGAMPGQAYNNYLAGSDDIGHLGNDAPMWNPADINRIPNQGFGLQYLNDQNARPNTMPADVGIGPGGGQEAAGQFQGSGVFGDLNHNFGIQDFQVDPGYLFRLQEGQKALERSAAAKGAVLGGAQLKALDRYNQGFASNEYTNAYNRFVNDQTNKFNRLAAVSGIGQTATNQLANQGTVIAGQQGNNLIAGMTGAANARASGYGQVANALTGILNQIPNNNNPYNIPGLIIN